MARKHIREVDLDRSTDTEHAENDKELPGDISKPGWNEEAESEVEKPVANGSKTLFHYLVLDHKRD